uniref:Putative gtpase-activating protein centaurin gamma n=1 Tax=Ornithodoros turicata TaxID=34597 RepID=A0A2R5L6I1_9ACAR
MNSRTQPYYNNSLAIRQEIQRFESVHPSIYAIYDLLEVIPDPLLAQQIREHVVCIEDSFVNSQEWTLSRSVPDIRLGIVGSLASGKSALVHRYLTGSYMQDESPEGGRFKKEIVIDGQSYLLLIRDEGGPPELQFSCWVDAVIFVFSLENEASFASVYGYFTRMTHFRSTLDVPLILVGTQDAISESNPRLIDDSRARKLAADLKRCSYYETCATYGLNVERVFQEACQKIVQQRMAAALTPNNSRPSTPVGHSALRTSNYFVPNGFPREPASQPASATAALINSYNSLHGGASTNAALKGGHYREIRDCISSTSVQREIQKYEKAERCVGGPPEAAPAPPSKEQPPREFTTPCSTPTTARKTRRRSNLFTPLKKADEDKKLRNGEMGSGRVIPIRQGYLYKKSVKALNKEWKKKYVTLTSDGRLTYHPSLHDYMDDVHGKEIPLMHTTVKIPGQKPRGSRAATGNSTLVNDVATDIGTLSLAGGMLNGSETQLIPAVPNTNPMLSKLDTPIVKKRHRRMKSTGAKTFEAMEDSDGYEFIIVSLDNKQWQFDASNGDDREGWVSAIEQQILSSLQGNESTKAKGRMNSIVDTASLQAIRTGVPGNSHCADCDTPHPDWASLNMGILICIECSGIHRNLGSHVSRVRSLDLDDWPPEHISVMMSLGNVVANSIWEGNTRGRTKPSPNSSREEKERWIRTKYEQGEFLSPLTQHSPLAQQLVEAVCQADVRQVALLLAHGVASPALQQELAAAQVAPPRDRRTPLHLAAALGNMAIVQLLLWHNANPRALDSEGRTALAYAKSANFMEIHDLLLHSGCPETINASTLSRRRGSLSKKSEVFDKLPASII